MPASRLQLRDVMFGAALVVLVGCDHSTPPNVDSTTPANIAWESSLTVVAKQAEIDSARVSNAAGVGLAGVTVTFSATSGTLSATSATTDTSGIATTTWTAPGSTGTATLTATVSGTTLTTSSVWSIISPQAATLTAVGGAVYNTIPNHNLTLAVKATTATGGPAFGTIVDFSAGSGSLSAPSATADSTGVATVQWTSPVGIGGAAVSASVRNAPSVQPVSYLVHVESGYPATVQSTFNFTTPLATNTAVPTLPVITVLDSSGAPVAGSPVIVSITNGSGFTGEVLTDAQGTASPSSWTTGPAAGTSTCIATVPDLGVTKAFSVTTLAGGTIVIGSAPDLPSGASVAGTITGPAGFTTQSFSVLQPGSTTLATSDSGSVTLPFGPYTITWQQTAGGSPAQTYTPSPTQTVITLSPTSPLDTARTTWR